MAAVFIGSTLAHSILDFGAVPNDYSVQAEVNNSRALYDTFMAANSTGNSDNIVLVPFGMNFSSLPIDNRLNDIYNVELVVDGTLLMSKHFRHYKSYESTSNGNGAISPFIFLQDCGDIVIRGKGTIDG